MGIGTSETKTILLLEADAGIRDVVEGVVLDHDLALHTAFGVDDALRMIKGGGLLAFLFDLGCLRVPAPEFVRKLKQENPDLPLIALADDHRRDVRLEVLQAGGYACLALPLQPGELAYNLAKIVANSTETYSAFSVRYEERTVVLPNDFSLVTQVAKSLVDTTLPPNEKHRFHIILGLSEIINNAIEHGNLGITFDEKSAALKASRFYPLAIERANRSPYKDRVVTIRARVWPDRRRIEYHVADQGAGFDWRSLPDPKDKENILNRNGRGILMARHAFHAIDYNAAGNEVTLVVDFEAQQRGGRA